VPAEVEALIEDKKTRLSSADHCTTLPSHPCVVWHTLDTVRAGWWWWWCVCGCSRRWRSDE
jgi:hypothetical protein